MSPGSEESWPDMSMRSRRTWCRLWAYSAPCSFSMNTTCSAKELRFHLGSIERIRPASAGLATR
ncbi:hypothetical protein SGRIM128S_07221 [Streptomyces griseomycini]